MSNDEKKMYRRCPICRKNYCEEPVISRKDNKTKICANCGKEEALLDEMFMQNENHIPGI